MTAQTDHTDGAIKLCAVKYLWAYMHNAFTKKTDQDLMKFKISKM